MASPAVSSSFATIDQLMPVLASCTKNALSKEETEKILTVVDKNLAISSTEARKISGKDEGIERSFLIGDKGECVILMTRTWVRGDTTLADDSCKTVKFCVNRKTGKKEVVGVSRDLRRRSINKISGEEFWDRLPAEKVLLELFRGEEEFVKLDFAVKTKHKFYFVMEYCDQGELYVFIKSGKAASENMFYALRDYLVGLVKMHAKGVIHRDLKPANLLLYRPAPDRPVRGKIADMGSACNESDKNETKLFCGTEGWFCPERVVASHSRLNRDNAIAEATTTQGDVFLMGCIIYAMFTGHPFLFQEDMFTIAEMDETKALGEMTYWFSILLYFPFKEEIRALIYNMILRDPSKRCTAKKALAYFDDAIFSKMQKGS